MEAAQKIIQHYNRLNGNSIRLDSLKNFHTQVQTFLDSTGTGPYIIDLRNIQKRITQGIKKMVANGYNSVGKLELIPIENKHIRKSLKETENKEPGASTKAKNAVAVSVPISKILSPKRKKIIIIKPLPEAKKQVTKTDADNTKPRHAAPLNGIVDASTLAGVKFRTFQLADPYKREFNKLNSDTQIMIWGSPGHGKSVYALKLAQYVASKLALKTLYVANEEFGRSTFADKINQFNIGHSNLKFTQDLNESQVKNFDAIIFDSINSMGMTLKDYRNFVKRNPGKLYILIVQTTKDGNFRGGQDWEHEVDTAGEIRNRKLILHKNRFDKDNPEKMEKLLTSDAIEEAKKRAEIRKAVKDSQVITNKKTIAP